jgi:hypothetical protein
MSMNVKPFRDISEHEVLNYYSTVEGTVSKGSFLQVVSFDPDNHNGYGARLDGVPDGAWAATYEVYAKVKLSTNATGTIGMALCDVAPVGSNKFIVTIADQRRYFDTIPSGQAVPMLKRGLCEIGGFSGTPFPGAKGVIVAGTPGQLGVGAANATPNVGTFLSTSGADGYAIFQVDCI